MKNLIIGMACAAALGAASAQAATTIIPKPAAPPAVSSGTAPGASGTVSVTPSSAAPQGAAPGGGVAYPGCADEIKMYCPNATGQNAVFECLTRNEGRLSDACRKSRAGQR